MANAYEKMGTRELAGTISQLEAQAERFRSLHLSLDMARGKPCADQIDLSRPMLDALTSGSDLVDGGADAGNYGSPDGLPSARRLAAEILGVEAANVIVAGSSSLSLMYSLVSRAYTHGIGGNVPWCAQEGLKFLCPSPGYDRHFAITEHFGFENVPVAMTPDGPDMDEVARLVEGDASVKGVWCVPKYENPMGITYADEVVRRFASLRPAAPDFRIFWDNAYVVHDLTDVPDHLLNIFDALAEVGRTDLVYEFASTSKVTFPGSGMAWVTASPADMAEVRATFALERVCSDKLSQLFHVRYLPDAAAVRSHMAEQAKVIRPRFRLVESKLAEGLGGLGCATWTHPNGGYFVSFDGPEGSARAIVALAADLGVRMTPAGATWPGGDDPRDANIRIAPTFPSLADLSSALDVFVLCVRLVSARLACEGRNA